MITITKRNIVLAILFSFLTCGIYMYYWIYQTHKDLNEIINIENYNAQKQVCSGVSVSGGILILLIIITCNIYGIYYYYKSGTVIDYIKYRLSGIPANNSIAYLLLGIFFPIIALAMLQNEINKYYDLQLQ